MKARWIGLFLAVAAVVAGATALAIPASAQTSGGQFCVRAFDDRNGNGMIDPGEPPFTHGISADLGDSNGLIIASALLEDSPTASSGFICFQYLSPGTYSVTVNSADYRATTPNVYTANITDTSIEVFEFGAQSIVASAAAPATAPANDAQAQRATLERLFFAVLGAGFVVGAMAIIGAGLYLVLYRRRPVDVRRSTGSMRAVQTGTGSYERVQTGTYGTVQTDTGSLPPVDPDDDTGRFRPPRED